MIVFIHFRNGYATYTTMLLYLSLLTHFRDKNSCVAPFSSQFHLWSRSVLISSHSTHFSSHQSSAPVCHSISSSRNYSVHTCLPLDTPQFQFILNLRTSTLATPQPEHTTPPLPRTPSLAIIPLATAQFISLLTPRTSPFAPQLSPLLNQSISLHLF